MESFEKKIKGYIYTYTSREDNVKIRGRMIASIELTDGESLYIYEDESEEENFKELLAEALL